MRVNVVAKFVPLYCSFKHFEFFPFQVWN